MSVQKKSLISSKPAVKKVTKQAEKNTAIGETKDLTAQALRAQALRAQPLRAQPLRAQPLRAQPMKKR
jgi:hypothetical protein